MAENNLIRSMVRGVYALQKLRIQMGNRITMNFKAKLGLTSDGMSEKELEAQEKKLLDSIRESYVRITDGIVAEGEFSDIVTGGKLPTVKKFKGDELISTYTELVLVDQYMTILKDEEGHFAKMQKVLEGIPIYDHFLSKVTGIGRVLQSMLDLMLFRLASTPTIKALRKLSGLNLSMLGWQRIKTKKILALCWPKENTKLLLLVWVVRAKTGLLLNANIKIRKELNQFVTPLLLIHF